MAARRYRRDMAQRKAIALKKRLCPEGSSACPINARTMRYECLDLNEELESESSLPWETGTRVKSAYLPPSSDQQAAEYAETTA
jgi:hypothetical protein